MSLVSVTKISSLILASVAEQASLSLTWSETPEDMSSHDEAQMLTYCSVVMLISDRKYINPFLGWVTYSSRFTGNEEFKLNEMEK